MKLHLRLTCLASLLRAAPTRTRRLARRLVTGITLVCIAMSSSQALESDLQQPIAITADQAEMNETTGVAIYQGQVVLSQGSLLIQCDQLTVTSDNGALKHASAIGEPAYFEQQPSLQEPKIEARANSITYLPDRHEVVLKTQAVIQQGNNRFEGDQIQYSLETQNMSASQQAIPASAKPDLKNRVRMILQPSTLSPARETQPDEASATETSATATSETATSETATSETSKEATTRDIAQ